MLQSRVCGEFWMNKRNVTMRKLSLTRVLLAVVLCAFSISPLSFAESTMSITTEENIVSIQADGRTLLQYRYRDTPFKPYVQQLFSPGGMNVLRDAPSDHLHHHALMFAVTVDGLNFWEEHLQPGRQQHISLGDVRIAGRDTVPTASFTERLAWINPRSKELFLNELRTIEACRLKEPEVTLLTWQSKFEPTEGKESVTLTGSAYFGLGARFLESMDTGGQFRNANGRTGVKDTNDKRAAWCAYTAGKEGKPVTIAIFDHPANVRHSATWFTMENPFAYISATLNLHKEPLKVISGKPLLVRYGVALWDGAAQSEQIEKVYKTWIAMLETEAR